MVFKMLELFAGSCNMSKAFWDYGFQVDNIDDNSERVSKASIIGNIRKIKQLKGYDVIWSSPPCTYFCRYSYIHGHWKYGKPNTVECYQSCLLHIHALDLIKNSDCKVWFIENPLGILKHMSFMQNIGNLYQLDYCMYGSEFKKATNVWSNIKLDVKKCNHVFRHMSFQNTYNYNGENERSVIPELFCDSIARQTVDYLENVIV